MITKLPFVRSLQLDHACIHKTTQGCHENLKDIFFPYAIICMHSVHVMTFTRVVVNVVDESHCREELTYSPLTDSFNCWLQWPSKTSCRDNHLMCFCSYSFDPEWSDLHFWLLPLQPVDWCVAVAESVVKRSIFALTAKGQKTISFSPLLFHWFMIENQQDVNNTITKAIKV